MKQVPSLVVIGHVAQDHIGQHIRLGGAASFAAQAAACLGVKTGVVTVAPEAHPLLQEIKNHSLIDLHCAPSQTITTFALDYSGSIRKVTLLKQAPNIMPSDIPERFCNRPVSYIAPVIGECGKEVIEHLKSEVTIVGAQGWLRQAGTKGQIEPALMQDARIVPPNISAIVCSELDHPDSEDIAQMWATKIDVVALTRGAKGITLFHKQVRYDLPATAVEREIDPTGAGDVFGVVLGLCLAQGNWVQESARIAMDAAAAVVENFGLGTLPQKFSGKFSTK